MAGVRLEQVSKSYDRKTMVIRDLNLEIYDGEFLVLVGPSGCGKSTILRMIAGLEQVTGGRIFIGERDVTDLHPKDRDIAMVFQNYALYPHMTVYDNIAFGLKLRKYPRDEIRRRVEEAAEILELKDFLRRKPKALSGGQRQRVALGRAIVRKPRVFLFDEPLSNLDAKLRVQMRAEIKRLHQELKTTIIYVTHDQTEAMTMGDRIAVLKDGVIHQIDTPINVYRQPLDTFVAGFIGSPAMNLVQVEVSERDPGCLVWNGFSWRLSTEKYQWLRKQMLKRVVAGIRPDQFYLQPRGNDALIKGRLQLVEMMGNETFLYLLVGEQQVICRSEQPPEAKINQEIGVYFNPEELHLFNAQNGKRLFE